MRLLLSQKNEFFSLIEQSVPLSPTDFTFSDNGIMGGGSTVTEIVHASNRYYYRIFDESISFSPGYDTLTYNTRHGKSWDTILTYYKRWLNYLLREISVEDKWTKMV